MMIQNHSDLLNVSICSKWCTLFYHLIGSVCFFKIHRRSHYTIIKNTRVLSMHILCQWRHTDAELSANGTLSSSSSNERSLKVMNISVPQQSFTFQLQTDTYCNQKLDILHSYRTVSSIKRYKNPQDGAVQRRSISFRLMVTIWLTCAALAKVSRQFSDYSTFVTYSKT